MIPSSVPFQAPSKSSSSMWICPKDFHPTNGAELLAGLSRLQDAFIAYIVTFLVLAAFWLARPRMKEEPEKLALARQRMKRAAVMTKKNRHIGSRFESWLDEPGVDELITCVFNFDAHSADFDSSAACRR